jgi:hypothetical protein
MAEREDWSLFRTVEGLQQRAGVPVAWLRRLVLKELGDNALDTKTPVDAGEIDEEDRSGYFIADIGPGLNGTPEEIAELFSIRRPMRSSKLIRLPQRGALGNGLRVVAGAVLASQGWLVVITRNRRIELAPQADGSTKVVKVTSVDYPVGTRIEIGFGAALPHDDNPLAWLQQAMAANAGGRSYDGASSPYWYDPAQFHELILAHGTQPLRLLVAHLDGCSGGKAGKIVAAAGLDRQACTDVTRQQATALLAAARKHVRPVNPERLGCIGREVIASWYAIEHGKAFIGSSELRAEIPFVVEAWAEKISTAGNRIGLTMLVNRSPVTGQISAFRDEDKDICVFGCGLNTGFPDTPTKGSYAIWVNITTPYCPITSDGKSPNLDPFADAICAAITTATKKAQRATPSERKLSQKDVVLEHLDQAIEDVSGDGEFRFNQRQLFYYLRPIVLEETGQTLKEGNFNAIITDYETDDEEIPGMYREPRGSIYHPHRHETIPLGTLTVENYERPEWTYNKIVLIEKEGWSEALKEVQWPERHDCMLMSSKGFTTRAARDLVDKLAEHNEPVDVFLIHDADAHGTEIYETFQEATKARGARLIKVHNLGLEPWEAIAMGLEVEEIEQAKMRRAVADYVLKRTDRAPDGTEWEEWLQTHRIELNAMTTPELITWLDRKMAEHSTGKLIPPPAMIAAELKQLLKTRLRELIMERILREAGLDRQVEEGFTAIKLRRHDTLIKGITKMFKRAPEREWRDHIDAVVSKLLSKTVS